MKDLHDPLIEQTCKKMEHSRIPMRGKTKDAEAEALLKLLRQEQEFHSQVSIPQIQKKQPLPSIRGKRSSIDGEDSSTDACGGVFISQMKTGLSDQELGFGESKFLLNNHDTTVLCTNNNTIINRDLPSPRDSGQRSYEWKKDSISTVYHKFERQRRPSKNLPPLGPQMPPSPRDREIRPSRPPPSSPKLWQDD